jgi:histone-lysine N-methyltransferase SETMAR
LKLGWATIPHSPYSPDLAPTDYHLFQSLSNQLHEKKFDDESNVKTDLADFFSHKSLDFYERGIFPLTRSFTSGCKQ